jgi:NOL1/NOP2/fmu family ribosome biogenesis protein
LLVSVSPSDQEAILGYWRERFGVSSTTLEDFRFLVRGKNVWAIRDLTELEETLASLKVEAAGLPFLRKRGAVWKPTTASLLLLGNAVVKNVVDLSEATIDPFLRGETLPGPFPVEGGYVAVRYTGAMLGCGLYGKAGLRSQLPRAWVETLLSGRPDVDEDG